MPPFRRQASSSSGQPSVSYVSLSPKTKAIHYSSSADKIDVIDLNGSRACRTVEEERLHTGKYLELRRTHFIDSRGQRKSAEGVHMVRNGQDGYHQPQLCTIAVLSKQILADSLVLVKQYRAPLKAYTIEFPARVLSKGMPQELASDLIEDDTGYRSTLVRYISPLTSLDPDISDGRLQFVSLSIDGDDPMQSTSYRNNNQTIGANHGAHGDIVQVLQVPIDGLLDRLEALDREGCVIDSRVLAFAIGLKKGASLSRAEMIIEQESPL